MTDPATALGIASSVISILELSGKVVKYIKSVNDSSEERNKILTEVISTSDLLAMINSPVKKAQYGDSWLATTESLCKPGGPVEQFESALKKLETKLQPATGLKKAQKALKWPFKKEEVKEMLVLFERQKSALGLAMQNDHM
jgi:hypothetical protein